MGRLRQRSDRTRAESGQPPDADPAGAPQFVQPVHAARVSNDGFVYVSDRGGKRVQVVTIDGTYVSQVFIGRECRAPDCGNSTTAASTAFSTDPAQRFLYVGNRSQAKVMFFDRRSLTLLDSFGKWGSAPGDFGTLHHMAVNSKGNLDVTEVTRLRPETDASRSSHLSRRRQRNEESRGRAYLNPAKPLDTPESALTATLDRSPLGSRALARAQPR